MRRRQRTHLHHRPRGTETDNGSWVHSNLCRNLRPERQNSVKNGASEGAGIEIHTTCEAAKGHPEGKRIRKVIFVPDRQINILVN